jgi:CheY-like chemotaxis protein
METEAKYKVFLVDDDTFLLNMYSVKLSKNGFEVNTALSGQEAIKKIKAGYEPDIMLLDVIMPGMDGLKVLEDIAANIWYRMPQSSCSPIKVIPVILKKQRRLVWMAISSKPLPFHQKLLKVF